MSLGDFMRAKARSGRWGDRDYAVQADLDELHAEAEAKPRLTDELAREFARDARARSAPPAPARANIGGFIRSELAYKRQIRREEHAAEAARANPSG